VQCMVSPGNRTELTTIGSRDGSCLSPPAINRTCIGEDYPRAPETVQHPMGFCLRSLAGPRRIFPFADDTSTPVVACFCQ